MKPGRPDIVSDLDALLEPFRGRVVALLELMRVDGFSPLVWETWRSPERCCAIHAAGFGALRSQHTLRLACDVLDAELHWDARPAFWEALHSHALAMGLGRVHRTVNGRKVLDRPHVQALPGKWDRTLWQLGTDAARAAFVAQLYALETMR